MAEFEMVKAVVDGMALNGVPCVRIEDLLDFLQHCEDAGLHTHKKMLKRYAERKLEAGLGGHLGEITEMVRVADQEAYDTFYRLVGKMYGMVRSADGEMWVEGFHLEVRDEGVWHPLDDVQQIWVRDDREFIRLE